MSAPKKVVLAYSGGLDTSIILKWLQTEYGCEVVTFTADLGQGEELEPARAKAETMGASKIYIEDLREEFVRDFVFPMFRANALYEGLYLLGTSIARPLISKRLVEIAALEGVDGLFFGPGDMSVAMGIPGQLDNPEIVKMRELVAKTARKHNKVAATVSDPTNVASYAGMGYNFLNIGADVLAVTQYADKMLAAFDGL